MLVNSSAATALTLLTGNKQANQTPLAKATAQNAAATITQDTASRPTGGVVIGESSKFTPELLASFAEFQTEFEGLRDGSISPFDTKYKYPSSAEGAFKDDRLLYEGAFVGSKAPSEGGVIVSADASFPDQRAAVANAYNYGTNLLESNQLIVKYEASMTELTLRADSLKDQIAGGDGDVKKLSDMLKGTESTIQNVGDLLGQATLNAERATASLTRMFSFDGDGITPNSDGGSNLNGFSISHGTYGQIMEISADGEITMFDDSGAAYTREEFVEQKPDGSIPQIHNDLIRENDLDQSLEVRVRDALAVSGMGSYSDAPPVVQRTISTDLADFFSLDLRF